MTRDGGDDLAWYLKTTRERLDAALERALPAPPACPAILSEAMRYSLFAGGKRLRPVLALASAEASARRLGLTGRDADDAAAAALPAACAVELVHTYSLIHDDLPAMDDDTLRRGRPTLHVVYGEGMAILAGDGLLTEAFSLLAREPEGAGPALAARQLRTLGVIAAAAGVTGMVGGQAIDLDATGPARETRRDAAAFTAEQVRHMHACKTGALLRASAVAGAIMAGGDEAITTAIDAFGAELGLAFQIVDDILDVEGGDQEFGKTAGKDAAAGKPTYPAVFGLTESKRLARESAARATAVLLGAGLGDSRLPAIADWVVSRTH